MRKEDITELLGLTQDSIDAIKTVWNTLMILKERLDGMNFFLVCILVFLGIQSVLLFLIFWVLINVK